VRWDQLLIEGERQSTPLPLALPNATVRTFDTPEFRGMTFYEVRAKSIINRVPAASRVPFEWTINPYRGCTHACTYCLAGETPILLADGGTRPLAELKVGDRIYGTAAAGAQRRYVATQVRAHWQTVKPAYRVRLADGTVLVASGDHRFLTGQGWKYVTGARRPHLTAGTPLLGVGRPAPAPPDNRDYRRGYLCGLIRGDVQLGEYLAGRRQRRETSQPFRLGLGLADREALARADLFLAGFGIPPQELTVSAAADLVTWPERPSPAWRAGLLAGLYDVQGGVAGGAVHITHRDPELITATVDALRSLGLDSALDRDEDRPGVTYVRLAGGLATGLAFLQLTDPAITRKRDLTGAAVGAEADLRVVRVEPLNVELALYDITTGTGDFVAGGVVSHNCFARNTHTYLDLDAGADFDTKVVVKVNAPELVRRELAAPRWSGAHIAMGTNVDCYQRAEGRYRLMPGILAALRDFANPFSILTKGTLILRDLELLTQAAEVTKVGLALSIGFVDETLWRSVEPGTPSPRRRLDTVRRLSDAGFAVGVLMAPVLPGLTDTDEQLEATVAAIARAGAASITPLALHLRPGAREWYLGWLAREHPHLIGLYREHYARGAYLGSGYQRELAARVRRAARRHGITPKETNQARDPGGPAPPEKSLPDHTQLTLL